MGRRSRKRVAAGADAPAEHSAGRASRTDREATPAPAAARPRTTRRTPGRTRAEDRPPPPWGSFPLTELLVLIALVLFVWGIVAKRPVLIFVGLTIGSVGGLELSIREHFGGFRSHTTLLSGALALIVVVAMLFAAGRVPVVLVLVVAAAVFAGAFSVLRQAFRRRSGGVGFRR